MKYLNGDLEQSPVYLTELDNQWDNKNKQTYADAVSVSSELPQSESSSLSAFSDDLLLSYQVDKFVSESGEPIDFASRGNYTLVSSESIANQAVLAEDDDSGIGALGWTGIGVGAVAAGLALGGGSSGDSNEGINSENRVSNGADIDRGSDISPDTDSNVEDASCDLPIGYEATAEFDGIVVQSSLWLSNGKATTAVWNSEEGTTLCGVEFIDSPQEACDTIALGCEPIDGLEVSCDLIFTKPFYVDCD